MTYIVIGGGGHGRVVIDLLKALNTPNIHILDHKYSSIVPSGVSVITTHDNDFQLDPAAILMANGIGGLTSTSTRQEVFERFTHRGYTFPPLAHPSAIIGGDIKCASGSQIMAGATVQTGTHIGINTIVNTGAILDHDCNIADHCLIAPGAVLAGGVRVDSGAVIGPGATIAQGVSIGAGCLVAAGAVVIHDTFPNSRVQGVPAREVCK